MPTAAERSHLRLVREPDPLRSYIRPMARDFGHVGRLLAAGFQVGDAIIVDACNLEASADLCQVAREEGLDVTLDPRSVELATPGGRQRSGIVELPWAGSEIERADQFDEGRSQEVAARLAEAVVKAGASSILAPTHFHESLPSPWFEVDLALTASLRRELDARDTAARTRIYFPLVSSLAALRSDLERQRVLEGLRELAHGGVIDAVWLRIHRFGTTDSGPVKLKRYIQLARDIHAVGIPVVAERTGTVGLALLAFGAVAGIESGITHGERFDAGPLLKPRSSDGKPFAMPPRVYFPQIGAFLKRDAAAVLLNARNLKNRFACQDSCCGRGVVDMLRDPRRHFLVQRSREINALARVPQDLRVEHYFDTWLRMAGDRATLAARVAPSLARHRDRLDQWRATLAEVRDRDRERRPSVSRPIPELNLHASGSAPGDRIAPA